MTYMSRNEGIMEKVQAILFDLGWNIVGFFRGCIEILELGIEMHPECGR